MAKKFRPVPRANRDHGGGAIANQRTRKWFEEHVEIIGSVSPTFKNQLAEKLITDLDAEIGALTAGAKKETSDG